MSFICHIHNYTEYNEEWNVFSAFNPSKCTHTWSSGQPTLRRPGSSWGFGALLKGLTSVVDTSCQSRDSNLQPWVTSPTLFPLGHDCPHNDCPLLYTNNCTSKEPSVKLLKFADGTTVIGLIKDGDESAYRQEVEQLAVWCSLNNLELNTLKTVEMIVDFRRDAPALPPLTIMDNTVTAVESFRFLGTTISQDLKWDNHIDSIVKKAQQRLYFLHQLRELNLPQELLKQFYSTIIESALCSSITVWFGSATKTDIRRLQRTVRTAGRIIGAPLSSLQEMYTSRVRKRAKKVTLDPSHPAHCLVELLNLDSNVFEYS